MQQVPLFDIIPLETFVEKVDVPSLAKQSDVVEIFFVTSGSLIRSFNLNVIRLNKDDLHLSLPGQITSIEDVRGEVSGYYCRFNDEWLEQVYLKNHIIDDLAFINSFIYRYPIRLPETIRERLKNIFSILCEMNIRQEKFSQLIHAYLITAIYEIKQLINDLHLNSFPSKAFLLTGQYYDLLMKYIAGKREMDFYAGLLGVTPNHLNKAVKAVTGKTAVAVRTEICLLEAKLQLKQIHKSIADIAFELGFSELSYFSRFFKKATGCNPLEYRKKITTHSDVHFPGIPL
jgi:AraC-like DNA-binding protein